MRNSLPSLKLKYDLTKIIRGREVVLIKIDHPGGFRLCSRGFNCRFNSENILLSTINFPISP